MPPNPQLTKFITASQAIASYSFSEFASGLGFIKFYLAGTNLSTGVDYILSEQVVFGNPRTIHIPSDLDFDLSPFNQSIVIKGVAMINLNTNWRTAGGSPALTYEVKIRKWDGTNETEIASATTETYNPPTTTNGTKVMLLPITIPRTKFSKGETLRITVDATVVAIDASDLNIDPGNVNAEPTASFASIPFEIEI